MTSNFKFKLLSHLTGKKQEGGFTLIELLVVVIIIGVLAAIALPNLLGQVGKARMAEAKSNVGALNRAQQAYRTERTEFGATRDDLDAKVVDSDFFTYTSGGGGNTATNEGLAVDAGNDQTTTITTVVNYDPAAGTFSLTNTVGDAARGGGWEDLSTP